MADSPERVPPDCEEAFAKIVALTDQFCESHLNDEYKQLCRKAAAVACREGLPLGKGKPAGWAAGIVCAVGWVNFLTDPTQTPHMTTGEIARRMGVSPSTMDARSKVIREDLQLTPFAPDFSRPSLAAQNPLIWIVEIDGLLIDIRHAPRGIQEAAHRRGLIPYIPTAEDQQAKDDL